VSEFDHDSPPESERAASASAPALPELGLPALGQEPPHDGGGDVLPAYRPLDAATDKKRKRVSRVRSIRVGILIFFLLTAGLGWVVRTVREANATPNDKAACAGVLSAVRTNGQTVVAMIDGLGKANDKTLLSARQSMLADASQRNDAAFVDDLNKAIGRCRDLSSEFRDGFHQYCQATANACKHTSKLTPF